MSLYASFHHMISDWIAARRAAETEALIGSLPADLRKDIGWPAESGRIHRRPAPAARAVIGA